MTSSLKKTHVALIGNPNAGKTTLFNYLTSKQQYVGNWPGVTVDKLEGALTKNRDIIVTDLPGVYSLSPYSPEEVVARDYLLSGEPEMVVNLVDATNLERNLYLTTQIIDLGIPVIIALNMMDLVEKNGDILHTERLAAELGCPVVEVSALKNCGTEAVIDEIQKINKEILQVEGGAMEQKDAFIVQRQHFSLSPDVEDAISKISACLREQQQTKVPLQRLRWYSLKLLENKRRTLDALKMLVPQSCFDEAARLRTQIETAHDDDIDSILIAARYDSITAFTPLVLERKHRGLTLTQKIDNIVTNRWLALPIFIVALTAVYLISVSLVGSYLTPWLSAGIFGEGWNYSQGTSATSEECGWLFEHVKLTTTAAKPGCVPGLATLATAGFTQFGVLSWLTSLVIDGILAGVASVLSFVPQLIVLFLMLGFLEASGYMARVAFMMDRIFRKFGLSGKCFIPLLIASGCGVPAVTATKAIENENDRRMTIMTATMIPCSSKLPIIALVFGAVAGGNAASNWWIAPLFYFIGVAAIIISGIMLRKTRAFAGGAAPFIMELPSYRLPSPKSVLLATWERVRGFIVKAGTVILVCSIIMWLLSNLNIYQGQFIFLETDTPDCASCSLLSILGKHIAWLFVPLGFGNWESAVSTLYGLLAKENVVATIGVVSQVGALSNLSPMDAFAAIMGNSTPALIAFCAFNLLCAPCFAAMAAIRQEMQTAKWTLFCLAYMTAFAWCVSLLIYQLSIFFAEGLAFTLWTAVAFTVLALVAIQVFRPARREEL
ncbi:MAG: ferrous iron transporter B [Eggerthellaceae bacterium]|nr:ferrous iron transporter B [Eggerthellaceae bacterium]